MVGGYVESLELWKNPEKGTETQVEGRERNRDRKTHRGKMQSRTEIRRYRSALTDRTEMPAERKKYTGATEKDKDKTESLSSAPGVPRLLPHLLGWVS